MGRRGKEDRSALPGCSINAFLSAPNSLMEYSRETQLLGPIPSPALGNYHTPPVPQFPHAQQLGELSRVRFSTAMPAAATCRGRDKDGHGIMRSPSPTACAILRAGSEAGGDPSSSLPDKTATFQIIPDSKFFESL